LQLLLIRRFAKVGC